MIIVNAQPEIEHGGLTIAKCSVSGDYEVYAHFGFVEGGFKSIEDAKNWIDSNGN